MILKLRSNEVAESKVEISNIWKVIAGVCLYYPLSIGLTFYQKWFLKFYKLPLLVVTCHYVLKYLLAIAIRYCLECKKNRRVRISLKEQLLWLVPIGICASLDIGLSNWALEYITVSLYTMAKSSSIVFIVAFALVLRLERWRPSLGTSAALIAGGLLLFTWRSSQFDLEGLLLIELAAACTGLRWTVSQLIMQSEEHSLRHPLDMVAHVQPWMIFAILPLLFLFEGSKLGIDTAVLYHGEFAPLRVLFLVSVGAIIAFAMELAEYCLLVHTSSITLNIFGIMKEVVTLLLAHFFNGDRLTLVNAFGLVLCFTGIFLHALSRRYVQNNRKSLTPPMDRCSLLTDVDIT